MVKGYEEGEPVRKKKLAKLKKELKRAKEHMVKTSQSVKHGVAKAQEYRLKAYNEWVKLQEEVAKYSQDYGTASLLGIGETTIGLETERRKKKKKKPKSIAETLWGE